MSAFDLIEQFPNAGEAVRHRRNEESMKKATNPPDDDEMRTEYDLRGGVRGQYYERYRQGTNVVLSDTDIADVFKDSPTVITLESLVEQITDENRHDEIETGTRVGNEVW